MISIFFVIFFMMITNYSDLLINWFDRKFKAEGKNQELKSGITYFPWLEKWGLLNKQFFY